MSFLPWAMKLDSAMAKMPKDVRNAQADGTLLDDSKGLGDRVSLTTAYRTDAWDDRFASFVRNEWGVGRRVADPGFFSASTQAPTMRALWSARAWLAERLAG